MLFSCCLRCGCCNALIVLAGVIYYVEYMLFWLFSRFAIGFVRLLLGWLVLEVCVLIVTWFGI